jgi:D-threonate/D-erythronate kinase
MVIRDSLPIHEVIVIADDLTGACDTAVAFSARGMKAEVMLEWNAVGNSSAKVIAIDTETRHIPVQQARQKLKSAMEHLNLKRFPNVFKKVDSVFRGNTLHEIAKIIEEVPWDLAIMAAAYPKLGRTSKDGVVRVNDLSGESTLAVRDGLEALGLKLGYITLDTPAAVMAETLRKNFRGDCQLVYCDAMSENDLQMIVTEGRKFAVRTLWIGSGGLAHALARDLAEDDSNLLPSTTARIRPSMSVGGSIFFFVGSDHLVTQAQVATLRREHEVTAYEIDGLPSFCSRDKGAFVLDVRHGVTSELAISDAFSLMHRNEVSCIFLTGGDTATFVCRALGIQSLQLQDEFSPGLPRGVAVGGPLTGSTVILKSGGFGETDVLCRIADVYAPDSKRKNEVSY